MVFTGSAMNHCDIVIPSADKGGKQKRANLLGQLRFLVIWSGLIYFPFYLLSLPLFTPLLAS